MLLQKDDGRNVFIAMQPAIASQIPVPSTEKDGSETPGDADLQLVFGTTFFLLLKCQKFTLLVVLFKAEDSYLHVTAERGGHLQTLTGRVCRKMSPIDHLHGALCYAQVGMKPRDKMFILSEEMHQMEMKTDANYSLLNKCHR